MMFKQVMKKIPLLFFLLLLLSCKFTPYSGHDVYNKQAQLPKDEAVHFKNSLEWWYFTGHLTNADSTKDYGVEYVVFHFNPRNKNDYLMTNFAITDPASRQFYHDYKIVKLDSLLQPQIPVYLEVTDKKRSHILKGSMGEYTIDANMANEDIMMSLTTRPIKPVLLHNGTGYEAYGDYTKAGYYTYPRLQAEGVVKIHGDSVVVTGELWYDRQWNCVGVWQKQVAWDWISVQLNDPQEELMLYRLHHFGDNNVLYGGSYYTADNKVVPLDKEDIELVELEYWKSKKSGAVYPVKWQVKIDQLNLDLVIEARIPNQELSVGFTAFYNIHYWEGMCSVSGQLDGREVTGKSYVELTNRDAFKKYRD